MLQVAPLIKIYNLDRPQKTGSVVQKGKPIIKIHESPKDLSQKSKSPTLEKLANQRGQHGFYLWGRGRNVKTQVKTIRWEDRLNRVETQSLNVG